MVLRVSEACRTIQRRLHKVLWNGGCVLPVMCVYNVLEKHNIPCTVVSGYYRPPVFWLQSQAQMSETPQQWLPHLWVEVDGFDDPIIDISSIGGHVYEFCQIHNIDPTDQQLFENTAKELGCHEAAQIYRSLIVCNSIPTATRVLGQMWKPHMQSQIPEYCTVVPEGEESVEQFGIPKHMLDEFADNPDWPNGTYFKKMSPGVKKLYTQVVEEPFEEQYDKVEFVIPVMKDAGELKKSPSLLRFDAFMKQHYKFLQQIALMPEHEALKHSTLLEEYKKVTEGLTAEDKMVMNMIANQKKQEKTESKSESEIKQILAEEIKGKTPEELSDMVKEIMRESIPEEMQSEESESSEDDTEESTEKDTEEDMSKEEIQKEVQKMQMEDKIKKKRGFRRDVR